MLLPPVLQAISGGPGAFPGGVGVQLLPPQAQEGGGRALAGATLRVEVVQSGPLPLVGVDTCPDLVPESGQCLHLGVVHTAQLERRRVVDPSAVVFLEPRPTSDQPVQGDGLVMVLEFGRGLYAGHVEFDREPAVEPLEDCLLYTSDAADE